VRLGQNRLKIPSRAIISPAPIPFFATIHTKRLVTVGRRELSTAELENVCGTATGELHTLFFIGLYTALRLGDAATLRWAEINFRSGMIVRVPNKTAHRHPEKMVRIAMGSDLRAILEEYPEESREEYVMPELATMYLHDLALLSRRVQAHFTACGITTTKLRKGGIRPVVLVGFHSLRHSFVSLCAEQGVALSTVQELCGHGSPAIQRHYLHMSDKASQNAIAALPSMPRRLALPAGDTAATEAPDGTRAVLLARLHQLENDASLDAIRRAITALEGTP
jgi:integrase